MLSVVMEKLGIWREALGGIDDLRGEQFIALENRVLRLEKELVLLKERRCSESSVERLLCLEKLG
jgi:hypothetical protein